MFSLDGMFAIASMHSVSGSIVGKMFIIFIIDHHFMKFR